MTRRPRWSHWALLGGVAMAMMSVPVAARTTHEGERPALVLKVEYGDSLWTLAQRYGDPNQDVRDVVTAMTKANDVSPGEIQPGDTLRIPAAYAAPPG